MPSSTPSEIRQRYDPGMSTSARRACAIGMAGWALLASCAPLPGRHHDQDPRLHERMGLPSRLMPPPARLAEVPPELRARLVASPIAFFRFVNQQWTREVCRAFASDVHNLPTVRLHGDAHVEQYAVTRTARGLDDFDDSASGPAIVDIVRFLGSLELTAGVRGWSSSLPVMVDAFFDGYRRALTHPAYLPADPAVVVRLREQPAMSARSFLAWADSLMHPLGPDDRLQFDRLWRRLEDVAPAAGAGFTPAFLARKSSGALHLGIGSALTHKGLARVEGPSPALDDDEIVEVKAIAPLGRQPCVTVSAEDESYRVVQGLRQIGRLEHRLVMVLPGSQDARPGQVGWWVKTWDRSYRELEVADVASDDELREIAHDVGAQLGSTNVLASVSQQAAMRRVERRRVVAHEARIRQVAHDLTAALLEAWQSLGRPAPPVVR